MAEIKEACCLGAILAGGKSSRMGEDKSVLKIQDKTLLERMESILQEANVEHVLVSRFDHIKDEISNCGPLGGIYSILNTIFSESNSLDSFSHVIFVPVDMPALQESLIRLLIEAPYDAPLVRFKNHVFPFRLKLQHSYVSLLEEVLSQGERLSLKRFQDKIPMTELETQFLDLDCFTNVNTPKEWESFIESTY